MNTISLSSRHWNKFKMLPSTTEPSVVAKQSNCWSEQWGSVSKQRRAAGFEPKNVTFSSIRSTFLFTLSCFINHKELSRDILTLAGTEPFYPRIFSNLWKAAILLHFIMIHIESGVPGPWTLSWAFLNSCPRLLPHSTVSSLEFLTPLETPGHRNYDATKNCEVSRNSTGCWISPENWKFYS